MKDPLFFNKVAAAGLAALLLFFGLPQLAKALRGGEEEHHAKAGEAEADANPFPQYPVEYAQGTSTKKAAPVDFDTLLATADPKAGERRVAICKSCHNLTQGGPNMTGPDLWGVVGRPVASHPGFNYTPALKAAGGDWTYDRLNKFLENSQSYIPGTAMTQHFPKAEQRAQIIAYLRTLSDNPLPLPTPKAPAATDEAAAGAADATKEAAAKPTFGQMLASANLKMGKNRVAICKSCHSLDKGGPNMTGPNLWGVVDRPVASHPGFNYTPALKAAGGKWTFDRLNKFLENSQADIPGTAMTQHFPKEEQRAQIIAYLRTLSDNPVPLPAADAQAAPAGDAAKEEKHTDASGSIDEQVAPYLANVEPVADAPAIDQKKVALGEALYNDPRLSVDGTVTCATCHGLTTGGVDRLVTSTGVKGQKGPINAPTVYNSAHNFVQFWDGRAGSLEEQAAGPVANPKEMGEEWGVVIGKLNKDQKLVDAMKAAYDTGVTEKSVTTAIADFERTLQTPNSPFDKYLKGDKSAISDQAKRGFLLFNETGCTACHSGAYFGGENYQVLQASYFKARGGEMTEADMGRYNVTKDEADKHKFKVPMLRTAAVTAPYFHDGSAKTLDAAVKTMAKHQLGKDLSDDDAAAIVAFLKSLTGEYKGKPLDKM